MNNIIPFDPDSRKQQKAIGKGLLISQDKSGNYYLALSPDGVQKRESSQATLNPYIVMVTRDLGDIEYYIKSHSKDHVHRFLSPNEVL